MKRLFTAAAAALAAVVCLAQNSGSGKFTFEPDGTYLFARRDTCDLFLDIYEPTPGSATHLEVGDKAVRKPTILYVFGGGFKEGSRNSAYQKPYFKMLCDAGYGVIAIDYRLGLKDFDQPGVNLQAANALYDAIQIAVEDLFDATAFILDNESQIGVNTSDIVLCGSSAGAITVLQAEWEISNGHAIAGKLPEGFNYAGVMSFSGAIFSREGALKYDAEPCPHFLCHGTADKTVLYSQIAFMKMRFVGTDLISKAFAQGGYCCQTWRFEGNMHEISTSMVHNFPEEVRFLEENVIKGIRRNIDATVKDPSIDIPSWARTDYKDLYRK